VFRLFGREVHDYRRPVDFGRVDSHCYFQLVHSSSLISRLESPSQPWLPEQRAQRLVVLHVAIKLRFSCDENFHAAPSCLRRTTRYGVQQRKRSTTRITIVI
jgi:hypothetical protein